METRCLDGGFHTEIITADEDGYDPRYIRGTWSAVALNHIGYCSRCHTAVQWNSDEPGWEDWPDANIVPHCDYCHRSMAEGQHHFINVTIELDTFAPLVQRIREVHVPPVFDAATFCGSNCLTYAMLDNERIQDAFRG